MTRDYLWEASAQLAKWFHWQPSEIDGLDLDEFAEWLKQSERQIKDWNSATD